MSRIQKILIANRGEIAMRIIGTCRKLNIMTGIVFSEPDRDSLAVTCADEKLQLAGNTIESTYLNIDQIISIAKRNSFDAIHPGYGFLAENAAFAKACQENSIIFIGPKPEIIAQMGDKVKSKEIASKAGVPVLEAIVGDLKTLEKKANQLDYPVLIKAVAGGGGKGMRVVKTKENLHEALISTSRESKNYFGDDRIFIEKFIDQPRHIEVQVLADHSGNAVALFDRECSLQRRYQKIIEEAPSPTLDETKRSELLSYALKLVKESSYTNAGTIEFMADEKLNFYFLEMNTRIQVEHPATELITGIDLVEQQIKIAEGNTLAIQQDELKINGHAIEARIYAEDPQNGFMPCPGKIHFYHEPDQNQIRIDSSIGGPALIANDYDPMIAKVISWRQTRDEAIEHLTKQLDNFVIHGVQNNISFIKELLSGKDYQKNTISTHYIDREIDRIIGNLNQKKEKVKPEALISLFHFYSKHNIQPKNIWEEVGLWGAGSEFICLIDEKDFTYQIIDESEKKIVFKADSKKWNASLSHYKDHTYFVQIDQQEYIGHLSTDRLRRTFVTINGLTFILDSPFNIHTRKIKRTFSLHESAHDGKVIAPMHGKIIEINIKKGQRVKKGEKLVVLEAMKMENLITSPIDGKIGNVFVSNNENVESGKTLVQINLIKTSQNNDQKKNV